MAIAQQLQAESTNQNNTGQTVSVTLGAGSSRYMVVALCADVASLAPPSSVTYGGNALALITDGTVTASQVSTDGGVFLYRLLEADMPANGAQNLTVAWGATTNYVMGWWILTGVNQANAADVKILAQTTTATTITITLDAGATTDAVICVAYKNDTTGTVAITISGAGVTEDFDVSLATGGARGAAGTDLPAVASGTIACVATVSSTNRRVLVGIRLAEAPAARGLSGGPALGAVTTTGNVTVIAPARNLSGGPALAPVTTTGLVLHQRALSGGPSTGPVLFDAAGALRVALSGGFTLGHVTMAASVTHKPATLSGGPALGAVQLAASVSGVVQRNLSGGFSIGAVTTAAAVKFPRNLSGGLTLGHATTAAAVAVALRAPPSTLRLGAPTVAALVFRARSVSGGPALGAVIVVGQLTHKIGLDGTIVLARVLLAASIVTQHYGSAALVLSAAGSVELDNEPAGAAELSSEAAGSATLETI